MEGSLSGKEAQIRDIGEVFGVEGPEHRIVDDSAADNCEIDLPAASAANRTVYLRAGCRFIGSENKRLVPGKPCFL